MHGDEDLAVATISMGTVISGMTYMLWLNWIGWCCVPEIDYKMDWTA
jgi:hypothetical protein